MNSIEHHWLPVILVAWALVSLIVLSAMLRSIVGNRKIARVGPPSCRANTLAEAAWTGVAIAIVVTTVLLTID